MVLGLHLLSRSRQVIPQHLFYQRQRCKTHNTGCLLYQALQDHHDCESPHFMAGTTFGVIGHALMNWIRDPERLMIVDPSIGVSKLSYILELTQTYCNGPFQKLDNKESDQVVTTDLE